MSKSVERKVQEKVKEIKNIHRYVSKNYLIGFSKERKVWKLFCKYGNNISEISISAQYFTNKQENEYVVLSSESLNKALSLLKSEVVKSIENNYE